MQLNCVMILQLFSLILVVLLNNYLCKLSFTSPFTEISGQANVKEKKYKHFGKYSNSIRMY